MNAQSTYRPTIRLSNIHTGDYRVSSADGQRYYDVNVKHITCTCYAGQTHFQSCKHLPYCKHVAAAKWYARVLHDSRQPQTQPVQSGAAGLLEAFGIHRYHRGADEAQSGRNGRT